MSIPLSEVKKENFICPKEPTEYTWTNATGTGKFTRTYIKYNQKDPKTGQTSYREAIFELEGKGRVKMDQHGKITMTVHLDDPADIAGIKEAYAGSFSAVEKWKGVLRMPNFSAQNPGDCRGVYFCETDKNGMVIEGSKPMIYLRFDESSIIQTLEQYKQMENGVEVMKLRPKVIKDHKILVDKVLHGSIMFSVRDFYRGTTSGVQCFIRCVMLSPIDGITEGSSVDVMSSAIVNKYMKQIESNPELLNALKDTVNKLQDSKDSLLVAATTTTTTTTTTTPLLTSVPAPAAQAQVPMPMQQQQQPQAAPLPQLTYTASTASIPGLPANIPTIQMPTQQMPAQQMQQQTFQTAATPQFVQAQGVQGGQPTQQDPLAQYLSGGAGSTITPMRL